MFRRSHDQISICKAVLMIKYWQFCPDLYCSLWIIDGSFPLRSDIHIFTKKCPDDQISTMRFSITGKTFRYLLNGAPTFWSSLVHRILVYKNTWRNWEGRCPHFDNPYEKRPCTYFIISSNYLNTSMNYFYVSTSTKDIHQIQMFSNFKQSEQV